MKLIKFVAILTLLCVGNKTSFASMTTKNAYQFSFEAIDGKKINLSDFNDKVILVVNTASKCGFTGQYKDLQELYEKYRDQGLVVIGVPSADFGNQEFSQAEEIEQFIDTKFNVTFPVSQLSKVKGDQAHPFYLWANLQVGFVGSPKWNFHKYLIDKNGNLAAWFTSSTNPTSVKVISKIEELIAL